ncbi:MAG: B12-binding domain-containing radical SAM protein, partial [Candidatus Adiutrix sp.]|nr:B12-binding domain-containing radical SAM protein [Candidatus Adiutrix sp.]
NFDFALVESLQQQCFQHGLPAAHYLIFGGPGETPATVEEGLSNLDRLPGCVAFISAGLTVYPNTPLAELAQREKTFSDNDFLTAAPYFSPDIDPAWLDRRLTEAVRGRRDRLYPPSAAAERTEALRRMGYRGILWDTLIGSGRRGKRAAQ